MVSSSVFYVVTGILILVAVSQYFYITKLDEYVNYQIANIRDFMECQIKLNQAFNDESVAVKDVLVIMKKLNEDVYGQEGLVNKVEYCLDNEAVLGRKVNEAYNLTLNYEPVPAEATTDCIFPDDEPDDSSGYIN